MNLIQIPKSFTIFGQTYKVKELKKVDKQDNYGEHDFEKRIIKIKKATINYPQDRVEEIYLHEVTHTILDQIGREDLSQDEIFVESFSRALHQIIKTSKYE